MSMPVSPTFADASSPSEWFHRGQSLREDGRLSEAAACQRRVLACSPRHIGAYLELSRIALARGELEPAKSRIRRALDASPRNSIIPRYLGNRVAAAHLLAGLGDTQAAIATYRAVLEAAPGQAEAWEGRLEAMDWEVANAVLADMERAGARVLRRTVPAEQITFRRFGDLCYRRQGYEIRVPVPAGELGPHRQAAIREAFEQAYRAIYGHVLPDLEIDVVSWRVVAEGPRPTLRLPGIEASGTGGEVLKGRRAVYMPEFDGFAEVPVYDRYRLAPGDTFEGPAIVEERESTVVLGPDARVRIDNALNLIADLT